jgi:hypothetical protein
MNMKLHRAATVTLTTIAVVLGCTFSAADASSDEGQALADELVLRRTELSESWTPEAHDPGTLPDEPTCMRVIQEIADDQNRAPHAESSFVRDGGELDNTVYVFPTVREAKSVMRRFAESDLAGCFQRFHQRSADEQVRRSRDPRTPVSVKVTTRQLPVSQYPQADDIVGFVATLTAKWSDGSNGQRLTGYEAMRVGRIITDFNFSAFSPEAWRDVINEFHNSLSNVTRVAAAGGAAHK